VNYWQLAFSECDSSLGRVVCSPAGLVNNPYSGIDHSVSEPVTHSLDSSEGDAVTLKHGLTSHESETAQKAQTT